MASDCYKVFKNVYNQGLADGLSSTVATSAAQAAQAACLAKQNARPATLAQGYTNVSPNRIVDAGPTSESPKKENKNPIRSNPLSFQE